MRSALPLALSLAVLGGVTSACSQEDPPSGAPVASALASATAPVPGVSLPADALLDAMPTMAELPAGMVPLLAGSGPRTLAQIAAFSADAAKAEKALKAHGFQRAYVAQFAHPTDGSVLSVVAVRFADASGAEADLTGDVTASGGTAVSLEPLGDQSAATAQALPDGAGRLLTLRFRKGALTWLLAYGAKQEPDPAVATALARTLIARAGSA